MARYAEIIARIEELESRLRKVQRQREVSAMAKSKDRLINDISRALAPALRHVARIVAGEKSGLTMYEGGPLHKWEHDVDVLLTEAASIGLRKIKRGAGRPDKVLKEAFAEFQENSFKGEVRLGIGSQQERGH
jgi:hypothetical protein